ncbi:hypothetical protein PUNSTDRAFT_54386 [Punctularia strigosozonata HHB-11173 SS5]|uniref:uncharacterized protein n=1 Tax=Punctularia strigosozonata (strain HHB-11173) TaxID=741275 RepID=UPI0004416F0C|nr:uncharacterized protein PUNSTDRAFT_54386 [Punctularia strigosozonata HHB-11173 SS5]EIN06076.1 hypothetical protein PUNSTDRAFT_54386 [Punctularia strigosozonata HHB-11173 SS5]
MFMSTKFLFVAASIGSALAAPAWPRQVAPQTAVSGTAVASAAGPTFTPGGLDNPPPVGSFLSIGHSAQSINRASLTATATTGCIRGVVSCLGADIVTCGDDGTVRSLSQTVSIRLTGASLARLEHYGMRHRQQQVLFRAAPPAVAAPGQDCQHRLHDARHRRGGHRGHRRLGRHLRDGAAGELRRVRTTDAGRVRAQSSVGHLLRKGAADCRVRVNWYA